MCKKLYIIYLSQKEPVRRVLSRLSYKYENQAPEQLSIRVKWRYSSGAELEIKLRSFWLSLALHSGFHFLRGGPKHNTSPQHTHQPFAKLLVHILKTALLGHNINIKCTPISSVFLVYSELCSHPNMCCNGIIQHVVFGDWLLSLSIMFSRVVHAVGLCQHLIPFYGWTIFRRMDSPHFCLPIHLLTGIWIVSTFGLLWTTLVWISV